MSARILRVLWVTNMFHEEGSADFRGIFVTQQWNALQRLGGVELERVVVAQGRGRADYLLANPRVRSAWERGRYDLVHVHYGLTGLATLTLPSPARRVYTFYGSDINLPVQRAIAVAVARKAKRRIFVSRRLAARWPSLENVVLANGVDFEKCRPAAREESCRDLGLDPDRRYVLFGAAPENRVKGYETYRAVLERVRAVDPRAEELVLSAPGQPYERVIAKMNAASVLLFTSRRGAEGSPTVLKEALVVNLPVVSVDVGDAPEALDGVTPGALVPWPADESKAAQEAWMDALTAAVVDVLRDGRRSDGRTKRDSLREERVAQATLEVYREAAP